jgi:hypothetical protein
MQWQAWIWCFSVYRFLSAWHFAFDSDNDGFSYSISMAKWNLSLSLSHEYHHPDHEWERWKQIVMSSFCRGANYLVMEMIFCVGLSSSSWKSIPNAQFPCDEHPMSRMRDEHPVSTGKLLIRYALGIRLAHERLCANAHLFCSRLTPALTGTSAKH